jgi:hypothetical protein
MSPEEVSVRDGDRVTMNFTSDSPIEIHVHGYDLEREVEPGERTESSFEARDPHPHGREGQIVVRQEAPYDRGRGGR